MNGLPLSVPKAAKTKTTQPKMVMKRREHEMGQPSISSQSAKIFAAGVIFSLILQIPTVLSPYSTVDSIPSSYFSEKKVVSGTVVKVIDGDTFRLRHTPFFFSSNKFIGGLKDNTIIVRIAAVDTPEIAKYGKPGQKYGKEAADFTKRAILGKSVSLKLLSKDKYNRALGIVKYKDGFVEKDLSAELLSHGLAVVYRQSGAQYDGGIDRWNVLEANAKASKLGIWSEKNVILPSEFKKKIATESKKQKTLKGLAGPPDGSMILSNDAKYNKGEMSPSRRGIRRYSDTVTF